MSSFSKRERYVKELPLVLEGLSDGLDIALWNVLKIYFWSLYDNLNSRNAKSIIIKDFIMKCWIEFFNYDLDTLPYNYISQYNKIKTSFFNNEWYNKFDFIEFINLYIEQEDSAYLYDLPDKLENAINEKLESFNSGYRLVKKQFIPVTNKEQLTSIEISLELVLSPKTVINCSLNFLCFERN